MKTKRVVFERPKEIALKEVELPEPSGNQVLVKTLTTLISTGTELTTLTGEFPPRSYWAEVSKYPFTPGYSNVGTIIKRGGNVDASRIKFPSLPGREGLGVSPGLMGVDYDFTPTQASGNSMIKTGEIKCAEKNE